MSIVLLLLLGGAAEGSGGSVGALRKRPEYREHTETVVWRSTTEGTEKEFVEAMILAERAVLDSMELLYSHLQSTMAQPQVHISI